MHEILSTTPHLLLSDAVKFFMSVALRALICCLRVQCKWALEHRQSIAKLPCSPVSSLVGQTKYEQRMQLSYFGEADLTANWRKEMGVFSVFTGACPFFASSSSSRYAANSVEKGTKRRRRILLIGKYFSKYIISLISSLKLLPPANNYFARDHHFYRMFLHGISRTRKPWLLSLWVSSTTILTSHYRIPFSQAIFTSEGNGEIDRRAYSHTHVCRRRWAGRE